MVEDSSEEFEFWDEAQTGFVLVQAARIEEILVDILRSKMRTELSREVRDKIFKGYGPVASFSAKIDICFAFGFINKDQYKILHHIRDIRNKFAHSAETLTFDHEALKANGNPLATELGETYMKAIVRMAVELGKLAPLRDATS